MGISDSIFESGMYFRSVNIAHSVENGRAGKRLSIPRITSNFVAVTIL
jgi:hypothetical protein